MGKTTPKDGQSKERACALISYFEVRWHSKLTMKLFPAKISEQATLQNLWCQRVKPGFQISGKSQVIRILLFPDCARLCRLMKTQYHKNPRPSGMDGDKSGESGAFLFSWRIQDFCDGQRSFPTNENSNLYRPGHRRWILLITNPLNCWAPVPYHT